jgi:PPE-repeat protein
MGDGMGLRSSAQRKASEPDSSAAAAAAGASAAERQRARRRRRAGMKDRYRGYEFMDLDPDDGSKPDPASLAPSSMASDRGVGSLGFAGTAVKERADAAGLTTLTVDEFGNGPSMPMLPGTWEPD